MFWWVLFGFGVLCLTGWIIRGVRNKWYGKGYIVGTTLSVAITGTLFALAVILPLQAKSNIAEMKEKKAFIEENLEYLSLNYDELESIDDFALSIEIRDGYFQYDFKLNQIKRDQETYGFLSKYYGMDLSELDLKLEKEC